MLFFDFSMKFWLEFDDLVVTAIRWWAPYPHVRPKRADSPLYEPRFVLLVRLVDVAGALPTKDSLHSYASTSKSKFHTFCSASLLLITFLTENASAPLAGQKDNS